MSLFSALRNMWRAPGTFPQGRRASRSSAPGRRTPRLLVEPLEDRLCLTGSWATEAPMLSARFNSASAVINGVLYCAGGGSNVHQTPTLQAYNASTNTWTQLADMPGYGRYGAVAGALNGKLYVVGGWDNQYTFLPHNELFIYDPAGNSWGSGASMPHLSGNGAAGVINGKLYVTTPDDGYNGYRTFLDVYDPASNSWTSLAPSPHAHDSPAFGVINGKLYVAGGNNESGRINFLDVYDPATNTWTTKASLPTAISSAAGAVLGGKLYVAGGYTASELASVEVYDPATDTWTSDTPMPTARGGLTAGVVNGALYAVGGSNSTGLLTTNEAFTPQDAWTGLGATTNWSDGDNWQGGTAPNPGDALLFPAGASQLANNNDFPDGTAFASLTFTGAGYDISGNAITLTSGMAANVSGGGADTVEDNITLVANTTFTVNAGTTLILSGNLGGGLQLNGTGVLRLAGSLDATSSVTVAGAATLDLPGVLTVEPTATLTDGGKLTVDPGGALDDFGLVTVANNGTLTDSSSGIPGVAGVQVEPGAELNVQGALTVTAGGTLDDLGSLPVAATGSLVDNSSGTGGVAGVQVEPGAILANQGTAQVTGTAGGNAILIVNGLMTGPLTVASQGFLEGTGSVGNITAVNGGTIVPGLIGRIGILSAQSVNLSGGGVLYIQVAGYQTPGTDFSRLDTGTLVLGGTSKLTLDLSGLTGTGTVRGIVTDGGQTGTFGTVQVINDPLNFGAALTYRNDNIDVTIS